MEIFRIGLGIGACPTVRAQRLKSQDSRKEHEATHGGVSAAYSAEGATITCMQAAPPPADMRLPYHRAAHVLPQTSQWWRPLTMLAMALVCVLGLMALVVVVAVAVNAAVPTLEPTSDKLEDGSNPIDLLLSLGPLALLIPASIWATRCGGGRWGMHSVFGSFRWTFMAKAAPVVVGVFVVLGPLLSLALFSDEFHVKHSWSRIIAALAVILIVTPFQSAGEEYLFRGLPQQMLGVWLKSPWWGILLPIPLFCVGHGYDWVGQIDIALFAFCAGLLVWKSGGLELAILVHATNNITGLVVAPFTDGSLAQGEVSPLSLLFSVPTTLGVTAYLVHYTNRVYGLSWRQPVTASVREAVDNTLPEAVRRPPVVMWGPPQMAASGGLPVAVQPRQHAGGPVMVHRNAMAWGGYVNYAELRSVADRAALYAAVRQQLIADYLEQIIGENQTFSVDNRAQRITLQGDRGHVDGHIEVVASVAAGPRSLMWGWAHPQGGSDSAQAVKRLGDRFHISALTEPEIAMDASVTPEDVEHEMKLLAHLAGYVATEAIRDDGFYYSAPTGRGQEVVFWVTGMPDLPQPGLIDFLTRIPRSGEDVFATDLRSGLLGIAEHRGWYLEWQDHEGRVGVLRDPQGNWAEVTFDQLGRIANLRGNIQQA